MGGCPNRERGRVREREKSTCIKESVPIPGREINKTKCKENVQYTVPLNNVNVYECERGRFVRTWRGGSSMSWITKCVSKVSGFSSQ